MIHTLTAYAIDPGHGAPRTNGRRVFGYCLTRDAALDNVFHDAGAMRACLYTYLVIEAVAPGIYGDATDEAWFHWNEEDREWRACDRPAWAEGICNHAMGEVNPLLHRLRQSGRIAP